MMSPDAIEARLRAVLPPSVQSNAQLIAQLIAASPSPQTRETILAMLRTQLGQHPENRGANSTGINIQDSSGAKVDVSGTVAGRDVIQMGAIERVAVTIDSIIKEMTVTNTSFTNSGTISSSNLNVGSTLSNVIQTINAFPMMPERDKASLAQQVDALRQELEVLARTNPKEADVIANRLETLINEIKDLDADHEVVEKKANRLKEAADNIASVLPTVSAIATTIIQLILKGAGMA